MRDVDIAKPSEARLAPLHVEHPELRQVARARANPSRVLPTRITILFVAANTSREQLDLDVEYRAIEESIRAARYRDVFQLIPKLAARPSDLQQALLEHRPDVVHFAGHGTSQAELLLLAERAGVAHVPAEALAATFRVLQDNVKLVVFNACFADEHAQAIRQSVGLAIGIRARIADTAAITFSAALYSALAYGRSVRDAFDLGVAAIHAAHAPQESPQLYEATELRASTVILVAETARPARRLWALGCAAACASLALGWWPLRMSERRQSPGLPTPGMVHLAGGTIRPGIFAMSQRPQVCASLTALEDAAVLDHPEKVTEAHVAPFELDVREVTNRQFANWLNAQPDAWKGITYGIIETRQQPAIPFVVASEECLDGLTITPEGRVRTDAEKANWPVVCVTWYGASEYCRAHGKRLPLEVEWELAAKGPRGRPFPWGIEMPTRDGVTFDRPDVVAAHPGEVGSSPQDVSQEGVHDLGGSVAEWVEDNRDMKHEKTIRGGSWASRGPCHLLGSGRKHISPERFGKDVGFRCASSLIHNNSSE